MRKPTLTMEMRKRPVTAEEAQEAVRRLINSHFHNPDRARMQIPVSAQDDDVVASDYVIESSERLAALQAEVDALKAEVARLSALPKIEVYQHDWIPGFAAFRDDHASAEGKAHVVLNVGSFLSTVAHGDVPATELPYFIAETIMHEVVHALEKWAGVEFSEDRVDALIQEYASLACATPERSK